MEQVAAAAGVGKGTVFHRFGNRTGLMHALMVERAQALEEAVTSGPPPLGPGAPDRDRLLAFLDAIIEVVGRNKSLLAELAYSAAADPASGSPQPPRGNAARHRDDHPVYRFWHGHISALIAAQRPGADAEMIAHLLLGALHSEPILAQLAAEGPARLTAAMRALACAVLDRSQPPSRCPPACPALAAVGLAAAEADERAELLASPWPRRAPRRAWCPAASRRW